MEDKSEKDKEGILRFFLMIEKQTGMGNTILRIRPINHKMPRTEIILLVEAWLKSFRDDFNDAIQSSIGSIDER